MNHYEIPISKYYELLYFIIGKTISASCFVIGWFMPFYFAGRLESGNVCEYFRMMHYFHDLGIKDHDQVLYEMGIKEKEHEVYFYDQIRDHKWLPFFERFFHWGASEQTNDVNMEAQLPVEESDRYCRN